MMNGQKAMRIEGIAVYGAEIPAVMSQVGLIKNY